VVWLAQPWLHVWEEEAYKPEIGFSIALVGNIDFFNSMKSMGCEGKIASLKIEQANGNNYMGAVTPNGTRWAYAARFADRLFVPMLVLGQRCAKARAALRG
jgi:hypothetical protein